MAMAKLLMLAVLVILGTIATVTDAQDTPSCAQKLVPCASFLNNATAKPTDDCCTPIKDAVNNDLTCLCKIYSDPSFLSAFNITVEAALRISRECGLTTDLSACKATAPASAPPPPGQPGGDNGADRIALAGFTTLLLFLVSVVLY